MRLDDKLIEDRDFLRRRPLTREIKHAITAIPTNVRSFKLEGVHIRISSDFDDIIECSLLYSSSLCGVKDQDSSRWLNNPEMHMFTRINGNMEGYHEIRWVIFELTHAFNMTQEDLRKIPKMQKYNLNTIKGYIQAVDKMARLLGWKKKEESVEQNNSVDEEAKQ